MNTKLEQFERLLNIMDELREKCPWDREQTLESLRHLTIEETYELGEAILNNDLNELKKELGDLLLHIVFYAKITPTRFWRNRSTNVRKSTSKLGGLKTKRKGSKKTRA